MRSHYPSLLVLGGSRSGKSRYALSEANAWGGRVAFVATAEPLDAEMAERIECHRKERPASWITVEEPWDLPKALRGVTDRADTVVVDCLTLWISNRIQREERDDLIENDVAALAALVTDSPFGLILVSNEVGWGGIALTPMGRRFSDLLGSVNQRLAAAAHRVVLVVAGLPLTLKGGTT